MCGFRAQLVEQRTGNAEVMGSNPVEALIDFFRLLLSNCLNWKIYCDDHSLLSILRSSLRYESLTFKDTKDEFKNNVMASLRCHGDFDCNKTQIIRNFHLHIIQLWYHFSHIFTHADVVNAQTWEVYPLKNPVEPP